MISGPIFSTTVNLSQDMETNSIDRKLVVDNRLYQSNQYSLSSVFDRSIGIVLAIVSLFIFNVINLYGFQVEVSVIVLLLFAIVVSMNELIRPLFEKDAFGSSMSIDSINMFKNMMAFVFMLFLFLLFNFLAAIATDAWKESHLTAMENMTALYCILLGGFTVYYMINYLIDNE